MGNNAGVVGGGNLGEQLKVATANGLTTNIIAPAVQSAATVTSGVIRRKGANAVTAVFNVGAIGSAGKYGVKVQDSADGVTFADLAAGTQGFGAVATAADALATANTDVVLTTDLRGAREYIQYVATLASGTSVLFGAVAVLGAYDVLPGSSN